MTVVETFSLQIVRDDDAPLPFRWTPLRELVREAEENLTDLLPDGYRAKIRHWHEENNDA